MTGFFHLKSPEDLYRKLKAEYELLKNNPGHGYVAFNFVVTGWHLREWAFPDSYKAWTKQHPILWVCGHLATEREALGTTS